MNPLHPRDLLKGLGWLLLYLLFLTPLFLVYWLIGYTEVFEHGWLWSLAGVAMLLVLARSKGHAPLVLGLCSLAFWIKVEPFLGLYLLAASASLFGCLHLGGKHRRLLFWAILGAFVILIPKSLPLLFATKPALWLWLRESLLLGFFLRYLWYEREFHQGKVQGQRFFEHLGYILFIPQLFKPIILSPTDQWSRTLEEPGNFWPAGKMFLLGTGKLLLFQTHLLIPVGLQENGAGSFISAWYQIFTHYLLWFLWLSAHCDYAVAVARLFGVHVPPLFHFPLLACSPRDFWQRWQVLYHRFLKEFIYQPAGGNQNPLRSIFLTFLTSALLFTAFWAGSSSWLPSSGFWMQWLPFFMIQASLVYLQSRLIPRGGSPSFFTSLSGWIFTQTGVAISCLLLSGLNRYPGDNVSPQTTLSVLRRALFFE